MSLLELLQRGDVDAFNAERSQRDRPDLFAADLADARLPGVDLSAAILSKADLTGADLRDATLLRADLSGCDATGIDLTGALAIKIKLRESYVDDAVLDQADLSHGDLTETVLTGTRGSGVRLTGASIRRLEAKGAKLPGAVLCEAKGHRADFTDADLTGADLSDAVLTEAILERTRLERIIAVRASFAEANLRGAIVSNADLREVNLAKADLSGADLRSSDLTRANLAGATLTGCDLRDACLAGATVDAGALAGVAVDGADLTGHDPRLLGVADADVARLAAYGVPEIEDAPLVVNEPACARRGSHVAMLWINADTDTLSTVRWAIVGPGGTLTGPLTVTAEAVIARGVVSDRTGFWLLLVLDAPGGVILQQVHLSETGELSDPRQHDLRYQPAVVPVFELDGAALRVTSLGRRGPTLIVQRVDDEGLTTVASGTVPTATGMWSRHSPVLATRGGVVIGVEGDKVHDPVRTPAGFPGRRAKVVRAGADLVAVWYEPTEDPGEPGWLRWATLGGRGEPTVRTVHRVGRLKALDVCAGPDGVHVAWVEAQDLLVSFTYSTTLPRGKARFLEAAGDAGTEVVFAPGLPTEKPLLVVPTLDRGAVVLDGERSLGAVTDGDADR